VSGAIGLVAVPLVLPGGPAFGIWGEPAGPVVWQVIDKAVNASEL
jgi:hypothetical protein